MWKGAFRDYTRRDASRRAALSLLCRSCELLLLLVAEPRQDTGIHRLALIGNDLEVQLVLHDLDQHEVIARVEFPGSQIGRFDVAFTQLRRAAGGEVVDALLWLDALVEVFVAAEHGIDAVLQEQRLEQG